MGFYSRSALKRHTKLGVKVTVISGGSAPKAHITSNDLTTVGHKLRLCMVCEPADVLHANSDLEPAQHEHVCYAPNSAIRLHKTW